MTLLDDRQLVAHLEDTMRRVADAATRHDRTDAVVVVDPARRRGGRRWMATAAASLVALGAGGVLVAHTGPGASSRTRAPSETAADTDTVAASGTSIDAVVTDTVAGVSSTADGVVTDTQPESSSNSAAGAIDTVWTGPVADGGGDDRPRQPIPAQFPADVPRPDSEPTLMYDDSEAVGWEFVERAEPGSGVQRCDEYLAEFDRTWTVRSDTDEAPSVLAAWTVLRTDWEVGVYCTAEGTFLVQVMIPR